jgi:hypothetical protein
MAKATKSKGTADNAVQVKADEGESEGKTLARVIIAPGLRHAHVASLFGGELFGDHAKPSIMNSVEVMEDAMAKAQEGDKSLASKLLATQALALDGIFTEMARRSGNNMGQYLDASERYMRLALKAQANCRATLETLAKLHQPREQTVKHVHVNEGGQAIVADQIHQHAGGTEYGKTDEQSHATRPAGDGPALLGADPQGNGVPIPGGAGPQTVPDARRNESRRT